MVGIRQVNITYDHKPDVQVNGQKKDFKLHTVDGKAFLGVKLQNDTYAKLSHRPDGKYDLAVFTTNDKALSDRMVKVRNGAVSRITTENGKQLENRSAQTKTRCYKFGQHFANKFQKTAQDYTAVRESTPENVDKLLTNWTDGRLNAADPQSAKELEFFQAKMNALLDMQENSQARPQQHAPRQQPTQQIPSSNDADIPSTANRNAATPGTSNTPPRAAPNTATSKKANATHPPQGDNGLSSETRVVNGLMARNYLAILDRKGRWGAILEGVAKQTGGNQKFSTGDSTSAKAFTQANARRVITKAFEARKDVAWSTTTDNTSFDEEIAIPALVDWINSVSDNADSPKPLTKLSDAESQQELEELDEFASDFAAELNNDANNDIADDDVDVDDDISLDNDIAVDSDITDDDDDDDVIEDMRDDDLGVPTHTPGDVSPGEHPSER